MPSAKAKFINFSAQVLLVLKLVYYLEIVASVSTQNISSTEARKCSQCCKEPVLQVPWLASRRLCHRLPSDPPGFVDHLRGNLDCSNPCYLWVPLLQMLCVLPEWEHRRLGDRPHGICPDTSRLVGRSVKPTPRDIL